MTFGIDFAQLVGDFMECYCRKRYAVRCVLSSKRVLTMACGPMILGYNFGWVMKSLTMLNSFSSWRRHCTQDKRVYTPPLPQTVAMSSLENELGILGQLGEPFIPFWDEALYDSPTTPWNVMKKSIGTQATRSWELLEYLLFHRGPNATESDIPVSSASRGNEKKKNTWIPAGESSSQILPVLDWGDRRKTPSWKWEVNFQFNVPSNWQTNQSWYSNLADVPSSPVESCQEKRQRQQREVKSQARRKNVVGKDPVFIDSGPSDIQFLIASASKEVTRKISMSYR